MATMLQPGIGVLVSRFPFPPLSIQAQGVVPHLEEGVERLAVHGFDAVEDVLQRHDVVPQDLAQAASDGLDQLLEAGRALEVAAHGHQALIVANGFQRR